MNGEDPNGDSEETDQHNESKFGRATDKLEGIREQDDEEGANVNVNEENSQQPKGDSQSRIEDATEEQIEYERLSEFFFDLCLSWCQHLDIETYVFFLNGIFLNITRGTHANISHFKDIGEIGVLSVQFFNKLLEYRYRCEADIAKGQSYAEWYSANFGRAHAIASSVQNNLQEAFEGTGETRILDLFMDLPKEQESSYLNKHFNKLDKDFAKIVRASKTTDLLTQTISFMETMRELHK